jgi:hypothetical protein
MVVDWREPSVAYPVPVELTGVRSVGFGGRVEDGDADCRITISFKCNNGSSSVARTYVFANNFLQR